VYEALSNTGKNQMQIVWLVLLYGSLSVLELVYEDLIYTGKNQMQIARLVMEKNWSPQLQVLYSVYLLYKSINTDT
jgi:hypothetical protein